VKVDIGFGGAFYAYISTDELGLPPTSIVPQVRLVRHCLLQMGHSPGNHIQPVQECDKLKHIGVAIKQAAMKQIGLVHPFEQDLGFLYGIFLITCTRCRNASKYGLTLSYKGPSLLVRPTPHSTTAATCACSLTAKLIDRPPVTTNMSHHELAFSYSPEQRAHTGTGVSGRLALLHARRQIEQGQPAVIESIIGTSFTGTVASATRFGPHEAIIPVVSGTGMCCIEQSRSFLTSRS
jgi:proline racemase